jgi:type VI secretion system protein ImpG
MRAVSDDLVTYYNRELVHIRRAAAEFATSNPKIAGRLRISPDTIEDPHVERLIEAFAFLTARTRQKLDDEFPEITDAMLEVLYPHYLAPIPSMAIAQFQPQPDLDKGYAIPIGTEIETEAVEGERCRFRTTYPVTLWPVRLASAALAGRPLVAPVNPAAADAVACLRLSLTALGPDANFAKLNPGSLRFFVRGQPQQTYPLYELILNDTIAVALADGAADPNPVLCGPDCLRPVGFGRDEGMLPYSDRSFQGYRLLTEFFAFPEKFLFFDLVPPQGCRPARDGKQLDVFLYLRRSVPELERSISAENFALGCAPAVNLFRQRAEPIPLDLALGEHRVVPDARRPRGMEVYRVERVRASNADGEQRDYLPFYSVEHGGRDEAYAAYWLPVRRQAPDGNPGSELFLSLVDLGLNPAQPAGWVLSVETTCLNRNIPERLPFGGGRPSLRLVDGAPPVQSVHFITPPTATLRPEFGSGGRWRLLSHLSLNHLSLADTQDGAAALKEILSLYDFRDSAETRAMIQGITRVRAERSTARVPGGGIGAFCRGVDIALEFDEARFAGAGLYLLASVLERFLGLYCSINSFVRLSASVKGRPGLLRKWPPRAGNTVLI